MPAKKPIAYSFDKTALAEREARVAAFAALGGLPNLVASRPEATRGVTLRSALYETLAWPWLAVHLGMSPVEIRARLAAQVSDALPFAESTPRDRWGIRSAIDVLLFETALLSGSEEIIDAAAELVRPASGTGNDAFAAWGGVLVACWRRDPAGAEKQVRFFRTTKADRSRPWPNVRLLAGIATGDLAALKTQLRQAIARYEKEAAFQKAISVNGEGMHVFDVSRLHLHFIWPYVEGIVFSLAHRNGLELLHHPH